MIVDTSALVAILTGEPEGTEFRELLRHTPGLRISAGSLLETAIVCDTREVSHLGRRLDSLVSALALEVVPVDHEQVTVARSAYREYGRGSGHPARLNFGDCFAYALASVTGEPLLFKGDDFTHTDLVAAL